MQQNLEQIPPPTPPSSSIPPQPPPTIAPPPVSSGPRPLPLITQDLENRILSLNDSQIRDDVKLKTLQEIWQQIEQVFNSSTYEKVIDKLMSVFLNLFCNTSPQFITENNTQQLRKLILEIILRISSIEAVKQHSKEVMKQMMRLISVENEDNAILAIKIIIDLGRNNGRMTYSHEVSSLMSTFKKMIQELTQHSVNSEMFITREVSRQFTNCSDEQLIFEYLKTCFHPQTVTLNGKDDKYILIPLASQSVKCLQEIPMLVVFFYQHLKVSVQTEALDFMRHGFDFLNVQLPRENRTNVNQALADDFYVAQSKYLSFVNIMGKVPAFMEVITQHGNALANGVLQLLEQCPADLISARKEVLIALKYFTSGDLRMNFFDMLPRLISETALLGTGFTSIDTLRTFIYQMLADLLHHMRGKLTFEMLSHVSFVFCRQLHDSSTNTQVQIMSSRLLNSVTESLTKMEQQNEPTRDLLFDILEALVAKLKVLAIYHIPLLFDKCDDPNVEYIYHPSERDTKENVQEEELAEKEPRHAEIDADFSASRMGESPEPEDPPFSPPLKRARKLSIDSVEELELCQKPSISIEPLTSPTKEGKHHSPEAILSALSATNSPPVTITDAKNLVKYILQTCKYATLQLRATRPTISSYNVAREKDLFERLLKYGTMCMDMYILTMKNNQLSKEDKETLESLANVFTTIDHGIFRELFDKYMDVIVTRIYRNVPLQLMVNTFLVRNEVPYFASIMLSFLMSRMDQLAVSNEKTALYVKLFKIIFSAIGTHHPNVEGEKMLKPFLPDLIRHSTILALSAREPLNYFLLLRALFRSIGGGAHDILYGKFLPLLPNLLQFLNKLQSCQHRLQMRELFVELCLTVPVRLSSLLPYLPLLMDPLVCALNGSPTLVQQGLRTLELCVDNLQPEYLYEHMAPVRGALMQGLWKVVATSTEPQSTAAAFRILGKFGGANRKMLNEPQELDFVQIGEIQPTYVSMEFSKMGLDGPLSIHLTLNEIMKLAVDQMKSSISSAEPAGQNGPQNPAQNLAQHQAQAQAQAQAQGQNPAPNQPAPNNIMSAIAMQPLSQSCKNPPIVPNYELRKDFMELAKSVMLVGLGPKIVLEMGQIERILERIRECCQNFDISRAPTTLFKCRRENDRKMYIDTLLVFFYGVIIRDDLRTQYRNFFNSICRHLTLIGILEYVGDGSSWLRSSENLENQGEIGDLCMDSAILIDALVLAFSDTNKDFCYSATVALRVINDTCAAALPDIDLMSQVPFCRYLIERIMHLCHGPAWFSRLGGASALQCIIKNYPRKFIEDNIEDIIDSLIEIILGTVDEIASGSVDLAMECLEKLQQKFVAQNAPNCAENCEKFIAAYSKFYFNGSEEVRRKMKKLLEQCQKISQLESTMPLFLTRFIAFFEKDIWRAIEQVSLLSLAESTASVSVLYDFLSINPPILKFENKKAEWSNFVGFILDLSQTSTHHLMQRHAYKKCETCAAHFLPPIPICEQVEYLRFKSLECLIACYKYTGLLDIQRLDGYGLSDFLCADQILIEGNFERFAIVVLRADLNQIGEKISEHAHRALGEILPIHLNLLKLVGRETLEKIDKTPGDDVAFEPSDIRKINRMFELNPEIVTQNMAQNMINFVANWKLDPNLAQYLNHGRDEEPIEEPGIDYDNLKIESWNQVESIAIIISILARISNPQIVTVEMAIEIAKFAADFEHLYSQDLIRGWLEDVTEIISRFPKSIIEFFFSTESIENDARRLLFRRIIEYPKTESLRKFLTENSEFMTNLMAGKSLAENSEMEGNVWLEPEENLGENLICDREYLGLSLINIVSKFYPDWFSENEQPIGILRDLWNSSDFKKRYFVRSPTEDDLRVISVGKMSKFKYKVPKMVVNCFLRYLRSKPLDFELLFDVITVFIGNYITDFCFVRQFLETEVIPKMSLEWRREAFLKIMDKFETHRDKTVNDLRVVKTIQYLIIPSLQWAFERYDVDLIVGEAKSSEEGNEDDPDNLVSRLTKVIDANRQKLSDGMVIVFYQLCTLFVQHASHHIHNNNYKKQGGRLRIFMLFAWPCLTLANHQDPTMRFTGFFFLANIIERFTINRKIVLQVFQCLTTTYQQDNRDQIRKAIDILTPAVPIRMEDGHQQILSSVKKVLIEECHNLPHIQHVFQMIIRNYRVYFHVRHELLTPLMNAVQRALIMPNSVVDAWQTRRMAIEVCEMVIKWDLLRNQKLEAQAQVTAEDAQEVDKMLEKLKGSSLSDKDETEASSQSSSSTLQKEKEKDDVLQKPISNEHVDQIVNMLVRFCVTFQQVAHQQHMQPTAHELIKKSQGLLRAALKPCVWGEIAHIRHSTIEKYLFVPNDIGTARQDGQNYHSVHCTNAQFSLDLILNLISVMPKPLLLQTLRPLQRSIISCLNSGMGTLVKLINSLVGRLFEKTRSSVNGLEELEIFNQYISKYLNDQFTNSIKHTNSPVSHIYTAFSLLRTICTHQPGYVDAVCLPLFVKITEKAAKEHISYVLNGQDGYREKGVSELVCLSLELLRPRIEFISLDMKSAIIFNVLGELIVKTNYEKVINCCISILGEMISTTDIEFTKQTVMEHLVRVQQAIPKFKENKDLIANFLPVVLRIYQVHEFRKSENGQLLWDGFFWGLTSKDAKIRDEFLQVWESMWPHLAQIDLAQRMRFILTNQDWSKFGQYFWLKHALWSMLRSVGKRAKNGERRTNKHVLMIHCATSWNTLELAARLDGCGLNQPSSSSAQIDQQQPKEEPMEQENSEDQPEIKPDISEKTKKLNQLLEEQKQFLEEAANFDFAQKIESISNIAFRISDTKVVSKMWICLFRSFWESLSQEERYEIRLLLIHFMGSGAHNSYISGVEKSVLAIWLETISPIIALPSSLIEFISKKHECWHIGIQLLEHSTLLIPKMLNVSEPLSREITANVETLESLANLYKELGEFDQFSAIWDRRAFKPETMKAMHLMQLGEVELAGSLLENTMSRTFDMLKMKSLAPPPPPTQLTQNGTPIPEPIRHITPLLDREYDHWQRMYSSCCSELLQWQNVADMANGKELQDSRDLLTAAVHISDWNVVEECRNQISGCIPPDFYPDYTIYNAMLTVIKNGDPHAQNTHKEQIKMAVQEAMDTHIAKWRALPKVVSYAHSKILQSMNIIREIEESMDLRCAIEDPNSRFEQSLLQDMKTLIKIWRNRTPCQADELSYVAKMYDWRLQIHCLVLKKFEYWEKLGLNVPPGATNHSILPIHSSAQGQLAIAKVARNLGCHTTAKDVMNRIAAMTMLPMLDSHQKVCDYAKNLRNWGAVIKDEDMRREVLLEAIECLEDVRIDEATREQIAKILYQRANVHSMLDQRHLADRAFSEAAQLLDFKQMQVTNVTVNLMKSWAHHLYKLCFAANVTEETVNRYGRQSICCYFTAARVDLEPKARKYIARILWLAKHMAICGPNSAESLSRIIKQHLHTLNVYNWIYWIPQLITEIRHTPNSPFMHILVKIIPTFPMQVFYHIRDTVPPELIEKAIKKDKIDTQKNLRIYQFTDETSFLDEDSLTRAVRLTLKYRRSDILVFDKMMKELDEMREFWVEKHIRFAICLKNEIFEDLSAKMDANFNEVSLTPRILELMKEWKLKLCEDLEHFEMYYGKEQNSEEKAGVLLFEKDVKRMSDDSKLPTDDEYTFVREISSTIIQNLSLSAEAIQPLKFVELCIAWIKVLKRRAQTLPRNIPLEITSPYLSRFSHRNGCIEMPYDLLNVVRVRNHNMPPSAQNQSGQYIAMVSRFEPKLKIEVRAGNVVRRFNIRGQTGKTCAFYLRKSIREPEKTNRTDQLFTHVNSLLQKDRETARRHLNIQQMYQIRPSRKCWAIEIAAIQPFVSPSECGISNLADQVEIVHPIDILNDYFMGGIEGIGSPDDIIRMFYERFGESAKSMAPPTSGNTYQQNQQPYHIRHIIFEDFLRDVVPNRILYDYFMMRYPDKTMYFMFRKQFIHCLAVNSVIETHCNLTPMGIDEILVTANIGTLHNSKYRFEMPQKGTKLAEVDKKMTHEVPFRLTPNFATFVGVAQDGDLHWSMAATARCLWKKTMDVLLKPLIWDEFVDNVDGDCKIYVCHATNTYVNGIVKKLENTNAADARIRRDDIVSKIARAKNTDHLARMPPTYHPWF